MCQRHIEFLHLLAMFIGKKLINHQGESKSHLEGVSTSKKRTVAVGVERFKTGALIYYGYSEKTNIKKCNYSVQASFVALKSYARQVAQQATFNFKKLNGGIFI